MVDVSVKGADVLLTAAARPTAAGWAEYALSGFMFVQMVFITSNI
jgi:hypothetical protein